ncbi:MAG: ABC transporter ATP-binding protein [Spirochaetes bacterium]|nr:ABC transporter ATP-binding protein [Spirochaetota bacterium]
MDKLLEVKGLVKNYITESETLHILKEINFRIKYKEKICITGESGSGKSTLLNLIGGLDKATSGSIIFEDMDIANLEEDELTDFRNKKIGFIFQDHYLLEEFTALENVMIPYLMNDFNKTKGMEKASKILTEIGLKKRINHYPSQLSGGEKQRVAIARAFINNPGLILADEPTGNLDEKNAQSVLELLFDITVKENHSLIIVSHSNQILKLAGKNYHLENGKLNLI